MRLPYIDPDATQSLQSPDGAAVLDRIRQRRHPRPLQPLDLALLHSPAYVDGFNTFMSAVTTQLSLPSDLLEITMCRVSLKNRAWYGWDHHAALAASSGVSDRGMKTLAQDDLPRTVAESGLSEKQWVVARYADAMTTSVTVPDELFGELKALFTDQQVVEITGSIACYNCLSRLLVALDVAERNGPKPF